MDLHAFDAFPSELPLAPPPSLTAIPASEPTTGQLCRCGVHLGVDRLDTFGCRVPSQDALRCACSFLQEALDS
jgi:hypothetical protein